MLQVALQAQQGRKCRLQNWQFPQQSLPKIEEIQIPISNFLAVFKNQQKKNFTEFYNSVMTYSSPCQSTKVALINTRIHPNLILTNKTILHHNEVKPVASTHIQFQLYISLIRKCKKSPFYRF